MTSRKGGQKKDIFQVGKVGEGHKVYGRFKYEINCNYTDTEM
jgi:hypothetical protein